MSKKQFLIISAVVVVLVIIIAFVFVLLQSHTSTQPTHTNTSGTTFPMAGTDSTSSTTAATTMTIPGQNGAVIRTRDFINNGVTIKDVENPGTYLVAGQLGYCLPDSPCTAATSSEFNILYDSTANSFTIALLREPLGTSRRDAEIFLGKTLGLSSKDLCSLNYYIGTTYTVNENYAGGNLGFSSCAGAVQLPQ